MDILAGYSLPLTGGLVIGVSASLLLLLNGRIAGISGICWNAISNVGDRDWRLCFIAGLVVGALVCHRLLDVPVPAAGEAPWPLIVLAGALTGFGTRLGSGCTSGHGVCGLGRLSVRSLAATIIFMSAGICTVYITRHII